MIKKLFLIIGLVMICDRSQAHLIVAQHGSLKFSADGAYLLASVAVSAFKDIDDDEDQRLSLAEYKQHRARIALEVKKRITLSDANGEAKPLKGLLLSPVVVHHGPQASSESITVMGKFVFERSEETLFFAFDLFGQTQAQRQFEISISSDDGQGKDTVVLRPDNSQTQISLKTIISQ